MEWGGNGVKFVNLKGRYLQVQWDGCLWLRIALGYMCGWAKSVCAGHVVKEIHLFWILDT